MSEDDLSAHRKNAMKTREIAVLVLEKAHHDQEAAEIGSALGGLLHKIALSKKPDQFIKFALDTLHNVYNQLDKQ